jgi:hypothetical protein
MPTARRRFVRHALFTGAALLSLTLAGTSVMAEEEGEGRTLPVDFVHNNLEDAPIAGAVWAAGPALKDGKAICSVAATADANVNLSCEGPTGIHDETTIAVNPANPDNMIAGANDYQLAINPGGHVTASTRSRATVTLDGGATWTAYPIRTGGTYQATGDPAVAFDAAGNAYYATLGFRFVGPANTQNPDILVSVSHDGGLHWDGHRVAQGSGVGTSVGDLLDKEYVAAWGDGNAIITFGDFRLGRKGGLQSGHIFSTVTHDAGHTWSTPVDVTPETFVAFVSTPVVTPDGRIFVAYEDFTHFDNGRDDYVVAELDPATGARIAGPFTVDTLIDGATDYPLAFGRQTYQDSLFRSWSAGNIAADPTDGDHLAVAWSDMRNSTVPAPDDPYEAVTNSDIVVSQSFDAGRTWSEPVAVELAGDQFQGWAAYDANGLLRIGFFDRSYDAANHEYGYTLATETASESLTFVTTELTTARSDPTKDNRWFAATLNPDFPFATTFLGDYSGIATTPAGGVVAVWTDLRNEVSFAGRTGADQDMYFAATP